MHPASSVQHPLSTTASTDATTVSGVTSAYMYNHTELHVLYSPYRGWWMLVVGGWFILTVSGVWRFWGVCVNIKLVYIKATRLFVFCPFITCRYPDRRNR